MTRTVFTCVGVILGIARVAVGCYPEPREPQHPSYCYDAASFQGALLRCVDRSATIQESRACRRKVHADCDLVETLSAGAHP